MERLVWLAMKKKTSIQFTTPHANGKLDKKGPQDENTCP